MEVGQNVTLDFLLQNHIKIVAKQDDINSRYINIVLRNNRQAVTLSENATATLNITRCDGGKKSYICHIEDNVISVCLSKWAVEIEGTLQCDVSVIENNERLTTMTFKVVVHANCCTTDDIEDADSEDILTSLVSRVTQHGNSINTNTSNISSISSELSILEAVVSSLNKPITSQIVTITCDDWEYNEITNKYECTIAKDTITSATCIIANELTSVLCYADVWSTDGSYTITAPELPTGAVNLLLIFF